MEYKKEYENDILTIDTEAEEQPLQQVDNNYRTNNVIEREMEKFNDYSNDKKSNFQEFEIIETYTPKKDKQSTSFSKFVSEQNSLDNGTETFIYEKTKPQKKLKRTSKIFVIVSCVIASLMGTLAIINQVNISSVNNSNISTTEKIANVGSEIARIDQNIEAIIDETNIQEQANNNNFVPITSQTEVELLEKNKVKEYESKTSFFDKICNFFSHLFGG